MPTTGTVKRNLWKRYEKQNPKPFVYQYRNREQEPGTRTFEPIIGCSINNLEYIAIWKACSRLKDNWLFREIFRIYREIFKIYLNKKEE